MESRLHQVLTIGMEAGKAKRAREDASATLTNPDDPVFLLWVIHEVTKALDNIVEPVNPNDAWAINPPAHVIAEYNDEMQEIDSRRATLKGHLAMAESNLRSQLSPFLRSRMQQILVGTMPPPRR